MILAGWVNQQQQEVIEYLRTENQVLKEKLGKKRILLSDDQRRRLAVQGKIQGRQRLVDIGGRESAGCYCTADPAMQQYVEQALEVFRRKIQDPRVVKDYQGWSGKVMQYHFTDTGAYLFDTHSGKCFALPHPVIC